MKQGVLVEIVVEGQKSEIVLYCCVDGDVYARARLYLRRLWVSTDAS
jgi:hypothetical protein